MALVIKGNEVYFGISGGSSYRFSLAGLVQPHRLPRFAPKYTIGDDTFENESTLSNWVISDQRGGIGIQEMMSEKVNPNRSYWSGLDTSHEGHMLLPPLATAVNYEVPSDPTGHEDAGSGWFDETKAYDNNNTTFAQTEAHIGPSAYSEYLQFNKNAGVTRAVAVRSGQTGASFNIDIDAYYNAGWNDVYEGAFTVDSWLVKEIGDGTKNVTAVRIRYQQTGGGGTSPKIYEVDFVVAGTTTITNTVACNFNSKLYWSINNWLEKYDTTDLNYQLIQAFDSNITDLIVSLGNNLFIGLGDSTNYQYMSTAEAFTATNSANVTLWIEKTTTKLFKINAAGTIYYSTDANSAAPTWAANGTLNLPSSHIRSLFLGKDASGNEIIYAMTRVGLYAHDETNALFYPTDVKMADSTNNGYGAVRWRGDNYLSQGIGCVQYQANSSPATIRYIGLDRDDGLAEWDDPAMYFSKFIDGQWRMYALTHSGGTGLTAIYAWNGVGWSRYWSAQTQSKDMHTGIISNAGTAVNYLWFDWNGSIYRIIEQSSNISAKKISGYTYEDESVTYAYHITPKFYGGSPIYPKLAIRIQLYLAGLSANETVQTLYAADSVPTSLSTGWTSLGTQTADGLKEYTFGSGAGLVFKWIIFMFKLVRGSTNTNSPDIRAATFSYLKNLDQKWEFLFPINIAEEYNGLKPKQQVEALMTLAETQTLLECTFRNDSGTTNTYFVKISEFKGASPTGDSFEGKYNLTVYEP